MPPPPFYFVRSQNYHPFSINLFVFATNNRSIKSFSQQSKTMVFFKSLFEKIVRLVNYSFFKLVWTILICWVKKIIVLSFLWTIKVVRTLIVIFLNDNIVHEKFHSFVRWMQISSCRPDVVDIEHWTLNSVYLIECSWSLASREGYEMKCTSELSRFSVHWSCL